MTHPHDDFYVGGCLYDDGTAIMFDDVTIGRKKSKM
jgi:hypothetical protein